MAYAELELTLRVASEGYTVDLRFRASDSAADSDLALGVPVTFDLQGLLTISNDWSAYGQALTSQLFCEPKIREAWATVRGFMQGANTPLRLRLRIDPGADALHALRWELLQDPVTGMSLCRSQRILFARYLDTDDLTSITTPTWADLRALVVVANPHDLEEYNLTPVDVAGELSRISTSLGDLPTTTLVSAPQGSGATLEHIVDTLRSGHQLLTLVCHGTIVKGRPILWLDKPEGTCDRISGETFVQRIADLPPQQRPLLVILAACQTAGRDHHAAMLAALAPQLSRAGVGAVIGMQGNVPMTMIEILLPRLLTHLRTDGAIDRALALARAALPDDHPWWIPVLFMRVRDGRLWANDRTRSSPDTPRPFQAGGLTDLARQLRTPAVRDVLAEFRTIFHIARDQIDLLNCHKALHDTLQELELPFNIIVRYRRHLDNPDAWDDMLMPIAKLQDYTNTAIGILAHPRLADESDFWIQYLKLANIDLDVAQAQTDPHRLDLAIGRYKHVLNRKLPDADKQLAICAKGLRLDQVTQALSAVQAILVGSTPNLIAQYELTTWISTFNELHARLNVLVPAHYRWQGIDIEIRRVAESLTPADMKPTWDDLLLHTTPLFGESTDDWAATLNALSSQITLALSEGAIMQARSLFISYQSRATRRFIEVDKALLATCNELREAGAALDLILRTLDEESR